MTRRKKRKKPKKSASKPQSASAKKKLEQAFRFYWRVFGDGTELTEQHRGIKSHINKKKQMIRTRHTFDFCVPELKLAIEIQGGIWGRGRHVRPEGYHKDRVKIRKAMLQGWIVLEYTTIDLNEDNAEAMILEVVEYLKMLRGQVYTYGSKGDFNSQIIPAKPAKQLTLPLFEVAS